MRQNTTHVLARKTALQKVTNSDVLVAITQLLSAIGANEVWEFTLKLLVVGKAVADIDVSLTGPAGSVLTYGDPAAVAMDAVGAEEIFHALVDDLLTVVQVEGVISTGATPGNLQALFAQSTANASDIDVLIGSKLELKRIDDTK